MKVYLSGPMRGIPMWNFPAFNRAEAEWRQAGHVVVSPASIDRALGITPPADGVATETDPVLIRRAMALDIQLIYHSDAIALLPGWTKSTGATLELALAQFLGLQVFSATDMGELNIRKCPWDLVYFSNRRS